MQRMMILGLLLLLPACAMPDGGLNLNASPKKTMQMANADQSDLPMCMRDDVEDWSDISD